MSRVRHGEGQLRRISRHILVWYKEARRDLPWRESRDPYRVWISEVMLQQTTVQTVIPYYERFIETFPTLEDLAQADPEEVLSMWSGLGYYNRARRLHAAVREVKERYGGELPREPKLFRSLPGVGEYTTAAVMSIACGLPLAVVDGNVARLLTRLFALPADLPPSRRKSELNRLASSLLPPACPGRFNEAMMDLGSLVCRPRDPRCDNCPVSLFCVAEDGQLEHVQPRPNRRQISPLSLAAAALRSGDRLLFTKPPPGSLLGDLWGLPMVEAPPGQGGKALEDSLASLGLGVRLGQEAAVVKHRITHHRIRLGVYQGCVKDGCSAPDGYRWMAADELGSVGLPSLYSKALQAIGTSIRGVTR